MRTMEDSTDPTAVDSKRMKAGYVDGKYQTVAALERRFPHDRIVTITVLGTTQADVVDIETGDCTPTTGVASIKKGVAHTAYCNLSTLPDVLAQIVAQHADRDTPIWTAHPTGAAHLCDEKCFAAQGYEPPFHPNVVATQYAWEHTVDVSLVADYWPGVDPKPVPPTPHLETFMWIFRDTRHTPHPAWLILASGERRWIRDSAEEKFYTGLGISARDLSPYEAREVLDRIPVQANTPTPK